MNKFAWLISIVFEPFALTFLAWVLAVISLSLPTTEKLIYILAFTLVSGLPPIVVLVSEIRSGKISNWFMTNRLERKDVELAWLAGSLALGIIMLLLSAPRLILALTLAIFLLSLALVTINSFWKMSFHMVGLVLFILVLLLVYSPSWLWITVFLPLVAWSRVQLGHHTLTQVTVGTIVTLLITYLSFSLFGLATF